MTSKFLTFFLFLIFSASASDCFSDADTLVFSRGRSKQVFLPLNEYWVFVKPEKGRRKRMIITGFKDSALFVRKFSYEPSERRAKREKLQELLKAAGESEIDEDSLHAVVMFSELDTLKLSEIRKIKIPNNKRDEMRRVVTLLDIVSLVWVASGLIFFFGFSFMLFFSWLAVGLVLVLASLLTEHKVIRMKKWKVSLKRKG